MRKAGLSICDSSQKPPAAFVNYYNDSQWLVSCVLRVHAAPLCLLLFPGFYRSFAFIPFNAA